MSCSKRIVDKNISVFRKRFAELFDIFRFCFNLITIQIGNIQKILLFLHSPKLLCLLPRCDNANSPTKLRILAQDRKLLSRLLHRHNLRQKWPFYSVSRLIYVTKINSLFEKLLQLWHDCFKCVLILFTTIGSSKMTHQHDRFGSIWKGILNTLNMRLF